MTISFSDETGFAVIDRDGKVFGQNQSVYFMKTVDRQAAQLINSPDDAYQLPAQQIDEHSITPREISIIDVRQIVTNTAKKHLIIRDESQPLMRYDSHEVSAIHTATKLIEQESPDNWVIKTEKHFFDALYGPVFVAMFLGGVLLACWFPAVDLEAGRQVKPMNSFRHRAKSRTFIAIARSLGTKGIKALAGVLAITCTLWIIQGVRHVNHVTTFNLTSHIVRQREREKPRGHEETRDESMPDFT